jgi:hypothetical protein
MTRTTRSPLSLRALGILGACALGGAALAGATAACNGPGYADGLDDAAGPGPTTPMTPAAPDAPAPPATPPADGTPRDLDGDGYVDLPGAAADLSPEWQARLAERRADYGAALRTASLRLRGTLPTLREVRYVASADVPRRAYEQLLDGMLEDDRFEQRMIELYRDTFRMGGGAMDSAPVFAARLLAEDRDFTEIFTATRGTCPSYDAASGEFRDGDCDNGVPVHAGVLTHPGVMQQFYSNLAFRRVRWVQEVFACAPFPAERGGTPTDVGGPAPYLAPWPFESISGATSGGRVDFHDVSSVICANCHATMNHIAPLFARFDEMGRLQADVQVRLPIDGSPVARMSDWLPEGEGTAWRYGVPAADLPALGRALAADPDVEACTVARLWNFAMGHGDVITQADVVPAEVIAPHVATYRASGHRLRTTLRAIFASEDFVKF